VILVRLDWVIQASRKQAQASIDKTQSKYYAIAGIQDGNSGLLISYSFNNFSTNRNVLSQYSRLEKILRTVVLQSDR
jgi:hypothetical protein